MEHNLFLTELSNLLNQLKGNLFDFLPNFLVALFTLLLGLLIARITKALVYRLIIKLPQLVPNTALRNRLIQLPIEQSARLCSYALFWIILFFFLTAATEVLGLPIITAWLSGIVKYLPNILIAGLIGFLGITGGAIVRDLIQNAAVSAGLAYGDALGRTVQYIIIFVSMLVATDQAGIDIAVLNGLIYIVVSTLLIGAVLAFSLGSRASVSNILAAYYLQNRYQEGQLVRIGEYEGEIIQITPTAVILKTEQGEAYIPAKEFSETTSLLLRKKK